MNNSIQINSKFTIKEISLSRYAGNTITDIGSFPAKVGFQEKRIIVNIEILIRKIPMQQ